MSVQRFDFAQFKATKTDEGFLVDSPIVGRIGIQTYMNADGTTRKEYRPAEEVFHPDALASMVGKPITDQHPNGKVTAANYKKLTIGTMLSGKQDGDNVRSDIVIQDAEAILKAEKGGVRELSLGYTVTLDETPGEYNGEKYDAVQRNIRANHLALVPKGRAGNARLNLDRFDAVVFNEETEPSMSDCSIKLDSGLSYSAAPEIAVEFERMRKDSAALKTQAEAAKAEAEKLAGERDTLKARVDGFAAELATAKADALTAARAEIKARAELEKAADAFKVDHAGKNDREVKEAVIKAVRADADLTGKSEEYVQAAFDMSVSLKADAAMQTQRKQVMNQDGTGAAKTASDKYKDHMANLSKGAK